MKCAICRRDLSLSSFSDDEFFQGPGTGQCIDCTSQRTSSGRKYGGGRYNNGTRVTFEKDALQRPFAEGSFRWVAKAVYTAGPRSGQPCVVKWFKSSEDLARDYLILDVKASEEALKIVNQFNAAKIYKSSIRVNIPQVWVFEEDAGPDFAGQQHLTEPYIENYQKFNSNRGWNDDSTTWGKVMQALSHFSYYVSGEERLLCDLQGGIYQNEAILTDPAILSRNHRFGGSDTGPEGMKAFFAEHRCNKFCNPKWPLPSRPTQSPQKFPGTVRVINRTSKRDTKATQNGTVVNDRQGSSVTSSSRFSSSQRQLINPSELLSQRQLTSSHHASSRHASSQQQLKSSRFSTSQRQLISPRDLDSQRQLTSSRQSSSHHASSQRQLASSRQLSLLRGGSQY
ncbi:hypothetical protein UA08_08609 [Talaromyces atroroseus]|uniref:Alpha-type protein kinase domain-containing protein n=1 Tax=Talaromyces atroroseus TaxID=1441469 RepID=A0A225A852_TALAT|nr:hypothetical protein UA08_08609 [Talaromyces atroroseus]OKL56050.1 hypothetical protein UA08_08609 [Talaromyces atroroseus]